MVAGSASGGGGGGGGAPLEASFDVIVIGGGHAGTEAAVAAARAGAQVALVTGALEQIGQLSCNPAIGGIAKGTVVREIDALGGIMGRATDLASIQFRMLNRGKGPAVWAPRAQCDRGLYRRAVRQLLEEHPNLVTIQGMVARLLFEDETGGGGGGGGGAAKVGGVRRSGGGTRRVSGVETLEGRRFGARAVVLTTGTFGRGLMHIGTTTKLSAGRAGEGPSVHLGQQLDAEGLTTERFKTGTPPRIDGRSVDFSRFSRQDSELEQFDYSWSHFWTAPRVDAHGKARNPAQLPCWVGWLEENGTELIASHINESALYGGAIASRGPRYCPSVEDKVVKFPDKQRHQLFLEPEGHDTAELYLNGLSSSLPAHIQLEVLRTVPGLESARMTRPGYAIEYDYYPPTQLWPSLESRAIAGLFFAGQVNGTTGYEEAGGQGVIAGLNAARFVQDLEPVVLGRETSYIGVLINDLVTRGVDEPYRLFTSRSEFRLTVRQDNALERLGRVAESAGLFSAVEREVLEKRLGAVKEALRLARETSMPPSVADPILLAAGSSVLAHAVRAEELAKRNDITLLSLFKAVGVATHLPSEAILGAELEIKYSGYFERERLQAARLAAQGDIELPLHVDYLAMLTVSTEARQKLSRLRPSTLAQASAIPGISPSDLQNLLFELKRQARRSTQNQAI